MFENGQNAHKNNEVFFFGYKFFFLFSCKSIQISSKLEKWFHVIRKTKITEIRSPVEKFRESKCEWLQKFLWWEWRMCNMVFGTGFFESQIKNIEYLPAIIFWLFTNMIGVQTELVFVRMLHASYKYKLNFWLCFEYRVWFLYTFYYQIQYKTRFRSVGT